MGCKVIRTERGYVALRLIWTYQKRSYRSQEALGLKWTPQNEAAAIRDIGRALTREMDAGQFSPLRYLEEFPDGNQAAAFRDALGLKIANVQDGAPKALTVGDWFPVWIKRYETTEYRPSRARDYRQGMTTYILPYMQNFRLDEIGGDHILELRRQLAEHITANKKRLSPKTARNLVNSTFRAFVRDARIAKLIKIDPYTDLEWPRLPTKKPDPFTEDERDAIIEHFRTAADGKYFVLTLHQFLTGMRPSETVALHVGAVDTLRGKVGVHLSRHLGSEQAPKTKHSERVIELHPVLREELRKHLDGIDDPAAYVFTNMRGRPIDQAEWPKDHWRKALETLKIRHRKWYATRHTFISLALSEGANLLDLARYCGTSVQMIEDNYGKFIPRDGRGVTGFVAAPKAKVNASGARVTLCGENPLENGASPTGFEGVGQARKLIHLPVTNRLKLRGIRFVAGGDLA